jgi:AraC family transcriptional regulator, melibiose operon regulatory protein
MVEAVHATHGLCAAILRPTAMPHVHTHAEIEMNLLRRGWMTYLIGGRFRTVHTDEATVFWAGVPHRLTEVGEGTEFVHVTVPLPWLLQLDLPRALWKALLDGEFLTGDLDDADEIAFDRLLFQRWTRDLAPDASATRRSTAFLEVEARLRRFAEHAHLRKESVERDAPTSRTRGQVEEIVRFLGEHYGDPIDVGTVAKAVGLHPNYAMTVFRESCGVSIWEYVIRLRVAHAQRLLISTDWTVDEIGVRSGFGSTNAFYRAFGRITGCVPSAFRAR